MEPATDILIDSTEAREILGVSAVNMRQIAFNHKDVLEPQGKRLRRRLFRKADVEALLHARTHGMP